MQEKRVPLRKCIGCGEMSGKKTLLRIVRVKDGEVAVDVSGRISGRGAYICRDSECFAQVRRQRKLDRALKCHIYDEIYDSIEKELNGN